MLHVQEFLKGGGTIAQLEEQWGIDATWSVKYPELVLLKYNQIESPMAAPIVQECRGIIFDSRHWTVVAHPFHKFFNVEEQLAARIDWDDCRVQEKLDGSLITMYWYDNQWLVATSGNPDAAGNVNGFDFTFEGLFWDTFRAQRIFESMQLDTDLTYMWELTSPFNKVVVQHKDARITLIGARHTGYGVEIPVGSFGPVVREFPLRSLSEVTEACKALKGYEQEGFVVVDSRFNRVKIKCPEYVMLHHTRDSMSPKGFTDVIRNGESDEFLAYFPEFAELFNSIKLKYQMFVAACDADWYSVADKVNVDGWAVGPGAKIFVGVSDGHRKAFAMEAKSKRLPGYLFARLDGKAANCAEYLKKLPIDNVMKLLELK